MDVASIRSALERQINPPPPTPLQRAMELAQAESVVSRAFLSASSAIEAQIIGTRLSGDITLARSNPAQVNAAYGSSVALFQDAQARSGTSINVSA